MSGIGVNYINSIMNQPQKDLSRYSNATSISSDQYFNEDEDQKNGRVLKGMNSYFKTECNDYVAATDVKGFITQIGGKIGGSMSQIGGQLGDKLGGISGSINMGSISQIGGKLGDNITQIGGKLTGTVR